MSTTSILLCFALLAPGIPQVKKAPSLSSSVDRALTLLKSIDKPWTLEKFKKALPKDTRFEKPEWLEDLEDGDGLGNNVAFSGVYDGSVLVVSSLQAKYLSEQGRDWKERTLISEQDLAGTDAATRTQFRKAIQLGKLKLLEKGWDRCLSTDRIETVSMTLSKQPIKGKATGQQVIDLLTKRLGKPLNKGWFPHQEGTDSGEGWRAEWKLSKDRRLFYSEEPAEGIQASARFPLRPLLVLWPPL